MTRSQSFFCGVLYNGIAKNPEQYILGTDYDRNYYIKNLLNDLNLSGGSDQEDKRIRLLLRIALNLYALDESRLYRQRTKSKDYDKGRPSPPSRLMHLMSQLALPLGTITSLAAYQNPGISASAGKFLMTAGGSIVLSGFASHAIFIQLPKHVGINKNEFDSFVQRSKIVCVRPEELEYFRLEQFFDFFTFRADSNNDKKSKIKEVFCNVIPALAENRANTNLDISEFINPQFFEIDDETRLRFEALRLNFYLMLER